MSVADGNQTVIEPPQTDGPNGPVWWYPYFVTWSPDGTTLLYTPGTREGRNDHREGFPSDAVVAVSLDGETPPESSCRETSGPACILELPGCPSKVGDGNKPADTRHLTGAPIRAVRPQPNGPGTRPRQPPRINHPPCSDPPKRPHRARPTRPESPLRAGQSASCGAPRPTWTASAELPLYGSSTAELATSRCARSRRSAASCGGPCRLLRDPRQCNRPDCAVVVITIRTTPCEVRCACVDPGGSELGHSARRRGRHRPALLPSLDAGPGPSADSDVVLRTGQLDARGLGARTRRSSARRGAITSFWPCVVVLRS